MLGKLLDSLSYRIEKNLEESIYKNETYSQNRWNTIEKLIILWTKKPMITVFLLIIIFLINTYFFFLFRNTFSKIFLFGNNSWGNLVSWQNNFLSTQITIIGLIFPLVIGFVSFLIQNKSSQRALWKIYMYYSGVKILGFSSLSLSAVIIFVQLIHPWLNYQLEVAISINIVFWLLFNVFLLAWFLYATFDFISTEKRSEIVLRYCINEMIINEIKHRLANLLPQTIFKNSNDNKEPEVYPFHPFTEKSDDSYKINFNDYKYVDDIHFRILKFATFIWTFRNKNYKGNTPTLYLPVSGTGKGKSYNLAYSQNAKINFLEKFLIRSAYSFRKTSRLEESNFDSIIHALISNVEDSLKEKDERLFEIAVDELAYWIIQIFKTASFKNDNGEMDNWILLPDGNFFGYSIIQNLSKEFYKINKKSIDLLKYSDTYFRKMCYFNLRIFGYKNKFLPSKVIEELFKNHYYIWVLLLKEINSLENKEKYLMIYISSWESWISSSKFDLKNEENIDYLIDIYLNHLQTSSEHIINALNTNNIEASLLSTDMLIYWNYQAFHMFRKVRNHYKFKSKLLKPSILKSDFESEYLDKEKLNNYLFPENSKNIKTALVISFENLWKEVCIISGVYIFYRYKEVFSDDIKKVVLSLLNQERIYNNNMNLLSQISKQIETHTIFESYLYNTYPLTNIIQSGYSAYLIKLFERINKKSLISGRTYTSRSIELSSLSQTIKCFLIGNSTNIWKLSKEINDFIKSPLFEYEARKSFIREINNFRYSKDIDDKLIDDVKLLFGEENIELKIENYKKSIENIIEELENYQNEILVNAVIDNEKVDSLNLIYSKEVFKNLDYIPYSLFNNIKFDNLKEKYTKKIDFTIDKKYLSKDINFIDINKYFENINNYNISDIKQNLVNIIFDKVLSNMKVKKEINFENLETLLLNVLEDAQKLIESNFTPIIFVCSDDIKWELKNEIHDKKFQDFSIEQFENKEESYICHIDNIEVYELYVNDGDYLILTSLEMFDEIIFNKFANNVYSKIDVLDTDCETEKMISFSYGMKLNFKEKSSYKCILKNKSN
ncbi:hypothetical protein [Aliarcobacter butzleri]|uniref:hypothetical protein n=1 Tax=Aliarcobacter butzleri TaxID=28197 RepID=UPI00263BF127|nr:hypothetical protein [Aliarcobacter butzleri]MDN5086720.1 hypothetical protein [Aliarcobacter butzleri]